MDVGILGLGTLGRALAQGLRSHPRVGRIVATTRTPRAQSAELADVIALTDNRELASASDVIMLCVKPAQMEGVVREIAGELRPGMLLVSASAAIDTASIHRWITEETGSSATPIVRAMPNMPCRIGAGMTALAPGPGAKGEHLATVRGLFEMLGRVVIVEERMMDAVTAISGCGPAYVYLIVEALAEAGVKLGLSRTIALELAAQTLHGASAMVLASGVHLRP